MHRSADTFKIGGGPSTLSAAMWGWGLPFLSDLLCCFLNPALFVCFKMCHNIYEYLLPRLGRAPQGSGFAQQVMVCQLYMYCIWRWIDLRTSIDRAEVLQFLGLTILISEGEFLLALIISGFYMYLLLCWWYRTGKYNVIHHLFWTQACMEMCGKQLYNNRSVWEIRSRTNFVIGATSE